MNLKRRSSGWTPHRTAVRGCTCTPYSETWVVLRGEARATADGKELRASADAIVTVPAETRHRFISSGIGNLGIVSSHASPTIVQEFVGDKSP